MVLLNKGPGIDVIDSDTTRNRKQISLHQKATPNFYRIATLFVFV